MEGLGLILLIIIIGTVLEFVYGLIECIIGTDAMEALVGFIFCLWIIGVPLVAIGYAIFGG